MKPTWFIVSIVVAVACGRGNSTPTSTTTTFTKNPVQYVITSLRVPLTRTDHAIDLNGDDRVDNQLGNLIGALAAQNLDVQGGVDAAITAGKTILLITHTSDDPAHQNDAHSGVVVNVGTESAHPDYSGLGTFSVDATIPSANLTGQITRGAFSSKAPATTTDPVRLTVSLPIGGVDPVELRLVGAHLSFTTVDATLVQGEIHGVMADTYVQSTLVPSIARALNVRVEASPTGSTGQQILQIFDVGCGVSSAMNLDGTPAASGDGKIAACEVSDHPIIKNVLSPDVQMFDRAGGYAPSAANTNKDSFTVGLGFSAVKAMF